MDEYKPTGKTALIIVPPPDVCGFADHYRRLYMPDMVNAIEPHITVIIPFVPYAQLEEAEPRLMHALSGYSPARVSIRGFGVFHEERVLYLRLADPAPVYALYRAVLAEFPDYPAYGGQHGDDWQPHMTVGLFTDPQDLEQAFRELEGLRLYIGFDVENLVVKYEMDDGIWDTWVEVPLASS